MELIPNPQTGRLEWVSDADAPSAACGKFLNKTTGCQYEDSVDLIADLNSNEAIFISLGDHKDIAWDFTGKTLTGITMTADNAIDAINTIIGPVLIDSDNDDFLFKNVKIHGDGGAAVTDTGGNAIKYSNVNFDGASSNVVLSGAPTTGSVFNNCYWTSGKRVVNDQTSGFLRFDYCRQIWDIRNNSTSAIIFNDCTIVAQLVHANGTLVFNKTTCSYLESTATAASGSLIFFNNYNNQNQGTLGAEQINKTGDCSYAFYGACQYNKDTTVLTGTDFSASADQTRVQSLLAQFDLVVMGTPYKNTGSGLCELICLEEVTGLFDNVNQVAHGLVAGEAIYFDGTDWLKANSASIVSLATALVSAVEDVDNFTAIYEGEVTGLSGLSSGDWYYASDVTPGALSLSPGVNFSNPILLATSATTGVVYQLRADSLTQTSGLSTQADYDSLYSRYLYTGKAARGTATSAANWRISRFDFTTGLIEYADSDENYDNIYNDREGLTYG